MLLIARESTLEGVGREATGGSFPVEAEKKREAKQRAKEAQEREVRKREKAEEKERRRKEYDALKASKREPEKKPKKETNQASSKCPSVRLRQGQWGGARCVPAWVTLYTWSDPVTPRAWEHLGGFAYEAWGILLGNKNRAWLACSPRGTCGVLSDVAESITRTGNCTFF